VWRGSGPVEFGRVTSGPLGQRFRRSRVPYREGGPASRHKKTPAY